MKNAILPAPAAAAAAAPKKKMHGPLILEMPIV